MTEAGLTRVGIRAIYEQCYAHLQSTDKGVRREHQLMAKFTESLPTPALEPPWNLAEQPNEPFKRNTRNSHCEIPSVVSSPVNPRERETDGLDSLGFGTSMLDGFVPEGVNMDQVFPFEGYNVEELWNWMVYLDSPDVS